MCGTWQSLDGDLPDTKAKLYQRFVTTLYQWKKPHLNWSQQQDLNAALGNLALAGMLNETERFQLRESVGYRVIGASQFELACRLGWLNLVARDGETLEGIYAFYHPTFQEYFAAFAVEDWHFFLNHIPKNPQHPDARYRIFEKQWKEVILLWLGREEVGKEEKEAFIKALVEFEDRSGFYRVRAYFLAAAGIAELKDCRLADKIVSQIVQWSFVCFSEDKQEWWSPLDPVEEGSREILKETDRKRAISALVELIRDSGSENTRKHAAIKLGEIDKNHLEAILLDEYPIFFSGHGDTRMIVADSLGQIGKDIPLAGTTVLLDACQPSIPTWWQETESLRNISQDNPVAIATLVELIGNSCDEATRWQAADSLRKIMKGKHFAIAVSGLKNCLTSEIYENDSNLYENCYQVIWNCAPNMTYPEFHQAWHTQPTNSPIPDNHRQNTDIPTLLKQLQPTDKTWVVPLNIRALEGETDTSAIAQELCTQLYQTIFPADTDILALRNAPEFKRLIPQLKNWLQKQHIALILHSCPCEDALSSFTRKLADTHMGIHIAWITDTPLEFPLKGFRVDGENWLEAVQNWIAGIGA